MPRVECREDHACAPIKGAPFTFRTLHPPDGRGDGGGKGSNSQQQSTIDKIVTITLPAIDGYEHKMIPTMEVIL